MLTIGIMSKPEIIEKVFPPGHTYPLLDLSYEDWIKIFDELKKGDTSFRTGTIRSIVHEVYRMSDGNRTIAEITEKISLSYQVAIKPENLIPVIESMERYGAIKIEKD